MQRIWHLTLLPIVMMVLMTPLSHGLSIDEAYQAIPHRQTTFDPTQASMSTQERTYLKEHLYLVDLTMAYRVGALKYITSKGRQGTDLKTYHRMVKGFLADMDALTPPKSLKEYHQLVYDSVIRQKAYFVHLQEGTPFSSSHPYVRESHSKLVKAYNILMKRYPKASQHNKQAFFDHLCALDFI